MTPYSRTERAALAALLEASGPDAPTLCAGWDTGDLAAHLVVRERRPDSGPGLLVSALAGHTERVRRRAKEAHSYAELVALIRQGPPRWSPMGLPGVEAAANTVEFFVHHEDVRRAPEGWQARKPDPGLEEALWQRLRTGARLMLRRVPVGVELARPDGAAVVARSGQPRVVLRGPASELTLYLFGRRAAALVDVEGDEDAVRALAQAPLGV